MMSPNTNSLQQELDAARAELAAQAALIRSQAEGMKSFLHDVRSPLSAISTWIEILRDADVDEGTRVRGLQIMAESVKEVSEQIDAWAGKTHH